MIVVPVFTVDFFMSSLDTWMCATPLSTHHPLSHTTSQTYCDRGDIYWTQNWSVTVSYLSLQLVFIRNALPYKLVLSFVSLLPLYTGEALIWNLFYPLYSRGSFQLLYTRSIVSTYPLDVSPPITRVSFHMFYRTHGPMSFYAMVRPIVS